MPISHDQQIKDGEHLKILAIFHFIHAGMALMFLCGLLLHCLMLNTVFSDPNFIKTPPGAKAPFSPAEFVRFFNWIYIIGGNFLAFGLILNVLSGIFLLRRKHRMFSLVVAGLNCFNMPLGTCLGVFTILVLLRDSVRESYELKTVNDDVEIIPPELKP